MKPIKRNLTVYQGASFTDQVFWKTGDPVQPVDMTGATARMQIRKTVKSTEVLFELTTENSRVTLGPEGSILLSIDPETTAGFDWGSGVYDLEIRFANGFVRRFMEGTVIVSAEVTRD